MLNGRCLLYQPTFARTAVSPNCRTAHVLTAVRTEDARSFKWKPINPSLSIKMSAGHLFFFTGSPRWGILCI